MGWGRSDAEDGFLLDLKPCALLRKVTIQVSKYKAEEHLVRVLGTFQSHKFETIEFIGPANIIQPSTWALVDNELCTLVDRLEECGWKRKLRVVIHSELKRDALKEGQLLARFRSKGEVVESVDIRNVMGVVLVFSLGDV